MEKFNRILDKAIIVIGRNGYNEGSWTDLYVNRFIGLYAHPGNKALKEGHTGEEITDEITITEPATTGDAGFTAIKPFAIEDTDMVPKGPSLVK